MEIKRVCRICYSATGNTEKVTDRLAKSLSSCLGVPLVSLRFTKPQDREAPYIFEAGDLVVVGTPTYAGKMPNKLLPDFQSKLIGNGALAVACVTFGGRSYDNALAELCAVLKADGFSIIAGGAFVGSHVFSNVLQSGRPNSADEEELQKFSDQIAVKLKGVTDITAEITVPGNADAPYYVPLGTDGLPAKFLKAKPCTDITKCSGCGVCAESCPMGAIDPLHTAVVNGICIKCHACVRKCPSRAKYFDDAAFLSHVAMLEQSFQSEKQNEWYL